MKTAEPHHKGRPVGEATLWRWLQALRERGHTPEVVLSLDDEGRPVVSVGGAP